MKITIRVEDESNGTSVDHNSPTISDLSKIPAASQGHPTVNELSAAVAARVYDGTILVLG